MAFSYDNRTNDVESNSNKNIPSEEDEELAALRLAALLSRKSVSQKKQEIKVPNVQDNDMPHSSFIKTQTGPPRCFRGGRRRGTTIQKSSHRSNLIIINPVTLEGGGNEQESTAKSLPKLVLPQHKWCISGTEDSMSPKSSNSKKKDAGRFSRFESDSDTESDFDVNSSSEEDSAVENHFGTHIIDGMHNMDQIADVKVPFEGGLESPTKKNCLTEGKISFNSEEQSKTENCHLEMTEIQDHFEDAELPDAMNAELPDAMNTDDFVNIFHKNVVHAEHLSETSSVSGEIKLESNKLDLDRTRMENEKCIEYDFNTDQNIKNEDNGMNILKGRIVIDQPEKEFKLQNSGPTCSDPINVNNLEQLNSFSPLPQKAEVSCDSSSTDLNEECQNHSLCSNDLRIQLKKRKLHRSQLGKSRKCRLSSSCSDSSTTSNSSFRSGADSIKMENSNTSNSDSSSQNSSPSSSDESYTPTVKSILSVVKPVSLENSESSNTYKKHNRDKCFNMTSRDKRGNVELRLKHNHIQYEDNHKSELHANKELLGNPFISEKGIRNSVDNKSETSLISNESDFVDSGVSLSSRKRLPVHMRLGMPAKKRYVEMKDTRKSVKSKQGWRKETAVELQPSNLRIVTEVRENFSGEKIDLVDKHQMKNKYKQGRSLNCSSWKKKQNSW